MNKKTTKSRVLKITELLRRYYPDANCALEHKNAHELLIATILSAQCTDARVNIVTRKLFKKYPTLKHFASADIKELEQDIRSTGFYKNKAKNIKSCAQTLVTEYGGQVPNEMSELIRLAGVGRKTANVVLGNAFGIASGIVVDTHVTRLSRRLGLTAAKTPEKIEADLIKLIPKEDWIVFSHWLILHGRQVCVARKPKCATCFLDDLCPKRI